MADPGLLGKAADLVPDVLLLVKLDGAVLDCNQAATRLVPGMRAGASLPDLVADPPDSLRRTLRRWARTGEPVPGALTFRGRSGPVRCRCRGVRATWLPGDDSPGMAAAVVQVYASPQPGQHSALVRDQFASLNREVSFRQRAAAERERLLAAEQYMRDRAQRLYRLSTALAASSTLEEVAGVVHRDVAASLWGITAVLGLFPEQVLPSLREPWQHGEPSQHREPLQQRARRQREPRQRDPFQQRAAGAWHDLDADPGGMLATAARSGRPTLITSPARPLAGYSARAASHDHAAYCIPLELHEQRLGVLAVAVPETPARTLLEQEQEHAVSVAAQVAQAVARARLFEHEHHLAEWLQRSLLPTLPALPHLTVATRYLPNTESARVGGDWYDLFELSPGQVGLAIGDVAGHSLAEATVMAQLRSALRAIAMEHRSPGKALKRLNEFTNALLPATMATACYLTLGIPGGWLSFASAGHLPPLLIPADGAPHLLPVTHGPALGATPDARYPGSTVRMADGDTLLLYTDGLVEQRGESLDVGLERLLTTARRAVGLDPEAVCDLLIRDQPGAEWQDDRALLVVRFERPSLP